MKLSKSTFMMNTYKVIFFALLVLISSCSRQLTLEDVEKKIAEAREEVQEAEEEAKKAVDLRVEFYKDYKETELNNLRKRNDEIDSKLDKLRDTTDDTNSVANANIQSAIDELREEQRKIENRISEVENIEAKDWSNAYSIIEDAISRINTQIDLLESSLNDE